jgi:multidrug efflux pump subunit AcrB
MSDPNPVRERKGPLTWMAKNSVASNLLMFALILGGLLFLPFIKQEVFPEFALDMVTVQVVYPGASPEESERALTKAIEENVRGVDGVKEVRSTSSEGVSFTTIELLLGTNSDRALSDIKSAVDRITSFPEDAERPIVSVVAIRNQVVSLVLHGNVGEMPLRQLAEQTRDELLADPRISTVELAGVRPYEINVEIPRDRLRAYGLTMDQVAQAIRAANVEVPAGGIKTEQGEILLRTKERRDFGQEFEEITILSRPDGSEVKLGDLARVDDSFAETDQEASFNGEQAAMVRVYRVGEQTPIEVSNAVREYIENNEQNLPPGVKLAVWGDRSEMYRDRIDLLMRNARLGLILVLFSLGLFLEIRLAFWVTLGIPISFLGTLLVMPALGASINMISLFAFIVTLGIVVDDAIVVGEAVHKRRQDGMPLAKAAIVGTHDVAKPVIFSVLTTIVAFSPLLFVPGVMGKFFKQIPTVVIIVLLLSLVESLLVLPAHLGHENPIARFVHRILRAMFGSRLGPIGWIYRGQQRFSGAYERFILNYFAPFLRRVVRHRYVALAVGVAILMSSCGVVAGGRIDFTFMPKIEMDVVFAQLVMPYGTPADKSKENMDRMVAAAKEVMEEAGGEAEISRGIFAQTGAANFGGMGRGPAGVGGAVGSHISEVSLFMTRVDERKIGAKEFAHRWRAKIGDVPGADTLKLSFTMGVSASAPISIELTHRDVSTLEKAASELAGEMRAFNGVKDIDDGVSLGKQQLNFTLKPEARSLGITEVGLARQVRAAFFGSEASRQQRGRDEVRVYVRAPRNERSSLHDLDQLLLRTPQGGEVPLGMAATIDRGRAYTQIKRRDGKRVLAVEADVEEGVTNANEVLAEIKKDALPALMRRHPGLSYQLSGQQQQQAESLEAMKSGFKMALILMFALMAIPFRSYIQPIIIMIAIPFGMVGALIGHLIMGYDLSMLSMMGLVALSGVVVNDSLVLISAVNSFRASGMSVMESVVAGGARRFRPIMLTSITTFLGLAPMIFEKSMQARFLIPMALSLGFGVLFATFIILLLVPSLYMIIEDITAALKGLFGAGTPDDRTPVSIDAAPAE